MAETISIKILDNAHDMDLPHYATEKSAGMDLAAAVVEPVVIKSGEIKIIPTGIAISLPSGTEAQVRPRSGLAAKHGVTVLNAPGTIDADYRCEIKAILINHGSEDFTITRTMRIAQLVIAKYEHVILQEVDSLDETKRGQGGFGSTGH